MTAPRYINHISPIIFSGPYRLQDTKLFLFAVEADQKKVQASVDSFFLEVLEGSNISYKAFTSHVALGAAYMDAISTDPFTQTIFGGFPETDYAVWIPLLKYVNGWPVGIYWFMSVVLVDNPLAIVTGREVYGFQKNQGQFAPPDKPDGPVNFSASAWSLETYSPTSRVKLFPLFELIKTGQPAKRAGLLNKIIKGTEELVGLIEDDWTRGAESMANMSGFVQYFHRNLKAGVVPMVFLKQFRSATNPQEACCRAVIETSFTITELTKVAAIEDEYQFNYSTNATYDFLEDYGVTNHNLLDLNFEIDMSFNLPNGVQIYPK